ncbi:RagB/SusD family nutrient uptake outer membrane protein, partial [Bacteroides cellulosilyticus]|nr:RagB/SusD family nutrient uptake outer membrane protein [Bacteroides cellulosilyticus]
MQVFDRVNDSRFWKSYITCYGANDTNGAPTWTKEDSASGYAPAGAKEGDKRFVAGELGLKYIVNNPGDTRYE